MQYEADKQCPSTLTLNPLAGGEGFASSKGPCAIQGKTFLLKTVIINYVLFFPPQGTDTES